MHSTTVAALPAGDRWNGPWRWFGPPRRILAADRRSAVLPTLRAVESATNAGVWALGFITYEAAPAFDPALRTRRRGLLPYTWWGLFDPPRVADHPGSDEATGTGLPRLAWRPTVSQRAHQRAVDAIRAAIARGETYQANLTFPLFAPFDGDPWTLFSAALRTQRAPFGTYLDLGRFVLASVSPELFFERDGDRLVCRPMKGTARRGRTSREDEQAIRRLAASEKDRAENVMIVDMMRNDLGRVARPGTVAVPRLFEVETYPTVHQLTSTVTAETDAGLPELLGALFPCSSITGAPKASTMRILRGLERRPRGIYTGAIGVVEPGGRARFSVAIRTLLVDRQRATVRYDTGGGIVWDSDPTLEYEECRTKAFVVTRPRPRFSLLETLRWTPNRGFALLPRHLDRMASSARYFGYPFDRDTLLRRLRSASACWPARAHRVRLLVDADGGCQIEHHAWSAEAGFVRVALDDRPVDPDDPFLFHKTTHRRVYEAAASRHPGADDVLLVNRRGELTESCRANLVLRLDGGWWTPPVDSGLLAGVLRQALLDRGRIRERVLRPDDLDRAQAVYLVNALRGLMAVDLGRRTAP